MASVYEVMAKITADASNFEAGMNKAQGAAQKTESGVGMSMGKLVKGVVGAAAAVGAVQFFNSTINSAVSLAAEFEGVNQVFGEGAKFVQDYAKQAADLAGVSESMALKSAKSFGVFASSAGLAGMEAGKFSTGLVQAAGDLGSFFDLPTEDALGAIQSGLMGQFEPLRKFNILLDSTDVEARAMAMGLMEAGGQLTDQAKIMATNELILEGLGVAQGDFVKYQGEFGNSIKTVGARFEELKASMGTALLPALGLLTEALAPIVQELTPVLTEVFAALVPVVEAVTASMAPLVEALMPIFEAITPVAEVFSNLIEAILPPFIDVIAMVAPIIYDLIEALAPLVNDVLAMLGFYLENFIVPILEVFAGIISTFVIPVIQFLAKIISDYVMPVAMGLAQVFSDYVTPVIQYFADFINAQLPGVMKMFQSVFEGIGKAVQWTWENILEPVFGWLADLIGLDMSGIGESFAKGFQGAKNTGLSMDSVAEASGLTVQAAAGLGSKLGTAVGTNMGTAANKAAGQAAKKTNAIKTFIKGLQDDFKKVNPFAEMVDKRGEYERQVDDTFKGFNDKIKQGLKSGDFGKGKAGKAIAKQLRGVTAAYNEQLTTIAKRVDAINVELENLKQIKEAAIDFQNGMKAITDATQPLPLVEAEIGRFENQVIGSFDAVNSKIEDGLKIGLISEAVANQLKASASATRTTLMTIAKQRDQLAKTYGELVEKLNASREFRKSTKDALLGVANITAIGKTARAMIRGLSNTLKRTNTFRTQLSSLQQMGLNKEAYNQIVNSGLDAGTATAKALLKGGPEAVTQINQLFGDLESSATQLAEQAESYMFDGGEKSIQGFIDGVIAQDEALRLTAQTEATAFNTAFQATIDAAQANLNSTISALESEKDRLVSTATMLATAFAAEFKAIVDAAMASASGGLDAVSKQAKSSSTSKVKLPAKTSKTPAPASSSTQNIKLTVNAGMGTNGAKLGQQITTALASYTKTSGRTAV
jgi:hypothetical protein